MTFDEVLDQIRELLQQRGRVTYRSLKRRFDLDDEYLEDLKGELIKAEGVAADEDGDVLVWIGDGINGETDKRIKGNLPVASAQPSDTSHITYHAPRAEGERRQLTVMFCDLVGSTALSAQTDPEELREVVRAYQETCTDVVRRYDGHIAQHLGDGLLVYFSYPIAHEDDAQRAVRTGLEILMALRQPNVGARRRRAPTDPTMTPPLHVRIGIHTGLVVIGDIGSSEKREILALGETPNIAARLQSVAEPDTVVISAATQRLVTGLFESQDLGSQTLKGISVPLSVYQVIRESTAQSRFEVAVQAGLTPLVGRDLELGLLQERWAQAQDGAGQVVLLSGEPGIGKSRLVQELKNVVTPVGAVRIEYRCSSYHQNSALYPLVEHVQRVLHVTPGDTPQDKLRKLEQTLSRYRFPQNDTVPLLASLLSLPQPENFPPLALSPQQQKQKTLDALVRWLFEEAERAPVYAVWEDLHWADPSTLEFLTVCLDQTPTARMLMVLTSRPEFTPTWASRSHISHLVLSRLGQHQSSAIVEGVTGGKTLPREVVQQIANKTDGVPLFVEELTKSVVESVGATGRSPLHLEIPATLQDSLMARLDRLGPAKEIAQMGATIGREFTYELLQAVSPLNEESLQRGLKQLVEAELVYQSGLPPQARYLFKHALIQDTAYQSLLKSTRQQYHQQIVQVLKERFPDIKANQPELLAHHYTEANLIEQAIPYWQQAGEHAVTQSANEEAISHLTKAIVLLKRFPETLERAQHELTLHIALGPPLMVTRGFAAPELATVYDRARVLCQQLGETPQLAPTLYGLAVFYYGRAQLPTARTLSEQILTLAQNTNTPILLLMGRFLVAATLLRQGEFVAAQEHAVQGIALYDDYRRQPGAVQAHHYGVGCLNSLAHVLWLMGYPDQARRRSQEALPLAQDMGRPFTLAQALSSTTWLSHHLCEPQAAETYAHALTTLCTDQGFPLWQAEGTIMRGWVLAEQGREEEGVVEICQGVTNYQATGAELILPDSLAVLAAVYGKMGRHEEGLAVVVDALARVDTTDGRDWEAELYRLKGELTLQQFNVQGSKSKVENSSEFGIRSAESEAEECFLKAIEISQQQQAKSWELRAATSLARLWQQQGKRAGAHKLLSEIYNWFTEGFETKDLQEAKALLESLVSSV